MPTDRYATQEKPKGSHSYPQEPLASPGYSGWKPK
jgi:hypothetical protein